MAPQLFQTLINLINGYRPTSIRETRRLKKYLLTCAEDMEANVVFLKHERLAAFMQKRAAERLHQQMLISAASLKEVQAAFDTDWVTRQAWTVTVAERHTQGAAGASFVTISSSKASSPTEKSIKRKHDAEEAEHEAKRQGFNSDGFGSQGFQYPEEFSDENSVNGNDENAAIKDGPEDLPLPAAPAAAAAMPAAYNPIWDVDAYVPY